nr:MAG TPA: immunity protein [Caudoviricetes sp.]
MAHPGAAARKRMVRLCGNPGWSVKALSEFEFKRKTELH